MKKTLTRIILLLCMMCLCTAALAEEVAYFTFDSNFTDGGNAVGSAAYGDPEIGDFVGREGVLYLDGNDAIKITAKDGGSLLTGANILTISYDSYCESNVNGWTFFAAPTENRQYSGTATYVGVFERPDHVHAERYLGGSNTNHVARATSLETEAWRHVEVQYALDGIYIYVNGELKATSSGSHSITDILGDESVLYVGRSNWNANGEYYTGYIDNLKISAEKAFSVTLSPFNTHTNNTGSRPNMLDNQKLHLAGSNEGIERISEILPTSTGSGTITLPDYQSMLDGFSLAPGGSTYILSDTDKQPYPQKLVGWYNIKTKEYYDVTNGPKTVTVTGSGNVFYADWVAVDYDFMPEENGVVDTTGTIVTADTSKFVKINVFDYTDLINTNSASVTQNGSASESWACINNTTDGHLAFFDSNYGSSNIGNPTGNADDNKYNNGNITYDIIQKNPDLIDNLFSPDSKVTGVKHLGEGNYLFSYNAATGMYSYISNNNGAVYQQSEGRFYVYDSPRKYNNNGSVGFFPLIPFDDPMKTNDGTSNYWFGMSAELEFWLPDDSGTGGNQITDANGNDQDMIFTFTGDDDLWVLIDGEVVLDLGGVHDSLTGTINFSDGTITVNSSNASEHPKTHSFSSGNHKMEIYYMERGGNASNCQIQFNLLPKWEAEEPGLDVVKVKRTGRR